MQSGPGRHFEQEAGEWAADDKRDRNAEIEQAEDFAAHAIGEPICQIQNRTWKETRFEDSENKSQHVERRAAADKHRRHRGQPPADHEKGEPPFCADPMKDEIAGESAE